MTDKSFYQAAAAEVEAGNTDQALWLKVSAEYPDVTEVVQRARYLQYRAAELASEGRKAAIGGAIGGLTKSSRIAQWMPTDLGEWIRYIFIALFVSFLGGPVYPLVLILLLAAPFIFGRIAKDPPREPVDWLNWLFVLVLALVLGGVTLWVDGTSYQGQQTEVVLGVFTAYFGIIAAIPFCWALVTAFRKSKEALGICLGAGLLLVAIRLISAIALRPTLHP